MESFAQTFFSENPEFDIWNNLKNFSYIEYVKKYFKNRNIEPDIKLLDTISGSISQAFEYFEASKVVSIQTAPLMLYYGTINLLFGASCLISGKIINVSGHGLALNLQTLENHSLLNVEVDIKSNQGAGFAEYLEILSKQKISQKHTIKLEDIFASIPELFREYIDINENRQLSILPLIKLIDDELEAYKCQLHYTQYHHIKKIETSKKYEQTFLPHQKNYKNELIFYVRLGKNESIKTSFLGEFFFQLEINETLVIEPIFLGVIGLYTLATLSRYYTDYWNSFIKNNKDGLINFIEKFLNFMRRYLPNYILDIIEDKKHIYTNHVVPIEDLRSNLSEKHIEERIKRIIQENIRS
ncbi:YaaC family protein [Streptococcus gordonii]|uniref:YaaC family protein n=1 Tax=Streptococcus gordonii TaxID=1302 RepID=UPI0007792C5F|nr:YaaC family protein [Streptococcus gordonii]